MSDAWALVVAWELVVVLGRLDASVLDICHPRGSLRGGVRRLDQLCAQEEWRGGDDSDGRVEGKEGVEI